MISHWIFSNDHNNNTLPPVVFTHSYVESMGSRAHTEFLHRTNIPVSGLCLTQINAHFSKKVLLSSEEFRPGHRGGLKTCLDNYWNDEECFPEWEWPYLKALGVATTALPKENNHYSIYLIKLVLWLALREEKHCIMRYKSNATIPR